MCLRWPRMRDARACHTLGDRWCLFCGGGGSDGGQSWCGCRCRSPIQICTFLILPACVCGCDKNQDRDLCEIIVHHRRRRPPQFRRRGRKSGLHIYAVTPVAVCQCNAHFAPKILADRIGIYIESMRIIPITSRCMQRREGVDVPHEIRPLPHNHVRFHSLYLAHDTRAAAATSGPAGRGDDVAPGRHSLFCCAHTLRRAQCV